MTQTQLIVDTNVREFFQGLVTDAVANQHVETTDETVFYVVNILVAFSDSRALFEQTPDGLQIKPLAFLYGEALEWSLLVGGLLMLFGNWLNISRPAPVKDD